MPGTYLTQRRHVDLLRVGSALCRRTECCRPAEICLPG
jgi:hypothetical protein